MFFGEHSAENSDKVGRCKTEALTNSNIISLQSKTNVNKARLQNYINKWIISRYQCAWFISAYHTILQNLLYFSLGSADISVDSTICPSECIFIPLSRKNGVHPKQAIYYMNLAHMINKDILWNFHYTWFSNFMPVLYSSSLQFAGR